jgi:hypothetical protein
MEEHRLRVHENRVLKGNVWAQEVEVTGGRGKQLNEEFHNLYSESESESGVFMSPSLVVSSHDHL